MSFRIVPLTKEYAARIRATGHDDFGNEIVEQVATGYGPCRVSLRPFDVGVDRRILVRHSPFKIANAFDQPGPIFFHATEVEEYSDVHRFPPEIKADPANFPLTLIGYSDDQRMVFAELVGDRDVDEMIEEIFEARDDVAYLHARNAEPACFICEIERA